jgi:hypothetical protein
VDLALDAGETQALVDFLKTTVLAKRLIQHADD